ncbi:immunoglobulin domain-containing protein, partial [Flavobacterium franklandianum]
MKNLYFKSINYKPQYLIILIALLFGNVFTAEAQVKKAYTQRTSSYTPTKKIYNIQGDFTMLGNTNLTPQSYTNTVNNNTSQMMYVDVDGNPNTWNSSSSTLALSTENGADPTCSKIIFAGLYWTGKSCPNSTFTADKTVPSYTQSINDNLNVTHNNNISNTNYTLTVSRNNPNPSNTNTSPIYTFTNGTNSYVFNYTNTTSPTTVTLSVNGGAVVNVPVTIVISGTTAIATLTTPYVIANGTINLTIKSLTRSTSITQSNNTAVRNTSLASVNVSGTVTSTTITKTFDKRKILLKGPGASIDTTLTANVNDIYYPSGSDDDIYTAYAEVTSYVRSHGIGVYTAADIALLEGNPGGTGYSGGWGMIVIYENSKMKYRDVTVFDGYAYVQASNTTGFTLPVSGFNTVQTGNVGLKLGLMASEGDVNFTGDYFQIQKVSDASYMSLSHSGNSATNFFNSSIIVGGARNPNLQNNTGVDFSMFTIPNAGNSVITNNQTSVNFKFGTSGDTYSIFAIAMAVDAYTPVAEAILAGSSLNGVPVLGSISSVLPGDEIGIKTNIFNKGTEAINNTKLIIPIPYMVDFVPGSLTKNVNFSPLPSPNNYYFDPSLGPKGSIVFDLGTLPLPVNPDTILADFSFKVKVTTDCSILKNAACSQFVSISGNIGGTGATTGINFSNKPFYVGFNQTGNCLGEPILNPLNISVNATNYVNQNCQNTPPIRNFVFCNPDSSIPITDINSGFPSGSRFFNQDGTIEYTISNPFPTTPGSVEYYALPPGAAVECNFLFTITVTNVSTTPVTVSNIEYCKGATAIPLSATATVHTPPYTLYYFTSETGTPQLSITPSTDTVGSITYWVAEAASGTCIGPKVPIIVTTNDNPAAPTCNGEQTVCEASPIQTLTATATGQNITWYTEATGGALVTSPTLNTVGSITYYAQASNGTCSSLTRTPVKLTINATPAAPVVTVVNNCESSVLTASNYTGDLLWSNNATTASITVTDTAIYTVKQTTANGCISALGSGTSAPKPKPVQPTLACYESASFDTATCAWIVTG